MKEEKEVFLLGYISNRMLRMYSKLETYEIESLDKTIQDVKYIDPCRGTKMSGIDLRGMLINCNSMDKYRPRHLDGCVFRYMSKYGMGKAFPGYINKKKERVELLENANATSDLIFIDVDHLSKDDVDTIISRSEELFQRVPYIVAIQKSSSYYLSKDEGGLHFYIASNRYGVGACVNLSLAIGKKIMQEIKNLFNIDSKVDENVLDFWHRFFLHYGEWKWNDNWTRWNFILDNKPVVENPLIAQVIDTSEPLTEEEVEEIQNNSEVIIYNGVKPLPLGHRDRFRIAAALRLIYNVDKKTWDLFWSHIWSEDRKDVVSRTSLNAQYWNQAENKNIKYAEEGKKKLEKLHLLRNIQSPESIAQTKKNIEVINMDEWMEDGTLFGSSSWMSSYVDMISKYIQEENNLQIQAPTGTGKTTMLSGYVDGKKRTRGLVDIFPRSIILVPYNVTNALYFPLNIVSSSTSNDILRDKPNVMIWDQFNKNIRRIQEMKPTVVFIDESHALFLQRSWRNSPIETMNNLRLLRQSGTKLVFLSATPGGEVGAFNSFLLKFEKKDNRNIRFEFRYTHDTFSNMIEDMKEPQWDRVCIFSDRDAGLCYANSISQDLDSRIYHSEWRENLDKLRKTEKLDSKINMLTCIAFEGLNFRNSHEKILVDIRYTYGKTTSGDIRQIIGRFRNNQDIVCRIYIDRKFENKIDLEQQFQDARIICNSECEEIVDDYWERLNTISYQEAERSIEEYLKMFDVKTVAIDLKKEYPVKFYEEKEKAQRIARRNPQKKTASDEFKSWRLGKTDYPYNENREIQKWTDRWKKRVESLVGTYGDSVWEMIDKKISSDGIHTDDKLVEGIVDSIAHILKIVSYSEEEWEEIVMKRPLILDNAKLSKSVFNSCKKIFDKDDIDREKYKNYDFRTFVDQFCLSTEIDQKCHRKSKSNGGKIGRQVEYEGKIYSTCKELAETVRKSEQTINSWLKKGKARYCS